MNLLLLGKGKTGSLVAEVAQERGHQFRAVGAEENAAGAALTKENLSGVDCVIDFTAPAAALESIAACTRAGVNMVVGTTGWYSEIDYARTVVEQSGTGFVYGSNFSIGVNVYFEIVRAAAAAVPFGYSLQLVERHHAQKKDAPSGTAVTMQQLIEAAAGIKPEITSVREGDTVGTHVTLLDSANDTMMLVHDAKSRRGFAEGAVRAAEWLQGKKGFYEFREIFRNL
jgi:4-hydroxy-tetrahydrodipicolinate reductase